MLSYKWLFRALGSFLTESDTMPEGPETLVRSPDLHQEIDNRYVVEKQPRRVSWSPELDLAGAGT